MVDIGGPAQGEIDHSGGDRFVGIAIDQDEGAGIAVVRVRIERDRSGNRQIADAHLVQRQRLGGKLRQRIDVDLVLEVGHRRGDGAMIDFHQVRAPGQQIFVRHPDQVGRELVGNLRAIAHRGKHVAAGNIDFVGERDGDRIAGDRGVEIAAGADNRLDPGGLPGRQHRDFIARPCPAAHDRAGKAAEIGIGTIDPLHRHPKRLAGAVILDVDRFQIFEQMRPRIPGRARAARRNIVAVARRNRDGLDVLEAKRGCKVGKA